MHNAEASTIGELFAKIIEEGRKPGRSFAIHLVYDETGDWSGNYHFDDEDGRSGGGMAYSSTITDLMKELAQRAGV